MPSSLPDSKKKAGDREAAEMINSVRVADAVEYSLPVSGVCIRSDTPTLSVDSVIHGLLDRGMMIFLHLVEAGLNTKGADADCAGQKYGNKRDYGFHA
jgi:hypothetical protein